MLCTLFVSTILGGDAVAWVRFVDKGLQGEAEAAALASAADALDPRARSRRSRARSGPLVDARDLPVDESYAAAVRSAGAAERLRSRWLNAISVAADEATLARVRGLPFVAEVMPVARRLTPLGRGPKVEPRKLDFSLAGPLDALAVPPLHACGLSGAGVRVAVLDTGFRLDHLLFAASDVVGQYDFVGLDANVSPGPGELLAEFFHGTQVLAIVAGSGESYRGVAPGVELLLGRVEEVDGESPADEDRFVVGLEWAEKHGADIISASVGYVDWYDFEQLDGASALSTIAAQVAADNGVLVVAAVGNSGPEPHTLVAPADGVGVLAVGAIDTEHEVAEFSSRGPTSDGRIKPDVLAPGMKIWTADAGDPTSYMQIGGTSAAAPFVAGIAALLLEASPETVPAALAETLRSTAAGHAAPDMAAGWGLVDAAAAHASVVHPKGTLCGRALAASPDPDDPDDPNGAEGCACRGASAPPMSLLATGLLALAGRRRRRAD